jgi:hypothetical protein
MNNFKGGNNMRKLTVKRRKSFVASLMKVKLYVSDETSNEITIIGVKCRQIGEVANGKEASFDIDNNEVVLFAIIDKVSKDFCNDKIVVKAGEEDACVTGKNKFSPFSGNPFIFDK